MRKLLTLLLLSMYSAAICQTIIIEPVESPENNFEKALKSIDNIHFYDFKFVNRSAVQKPKYKIYVSEYIRGKLTKQSVFAEANLNFPGNSFDNNELPFSILSKYEGDNSFKVLFRVGNMMNYIRKFDARRDDRYDLKMLTGLGRGFEPGKKQLFCAVVKPIKVDEHTYRDCDLNSALDKFDQWYSVFGLDRYYIFELVFEP